MNIRHGYAHLNSPEIRSLLHFPEILKFRTMEGALDMLSLIRQNYIVGSIDRIEYDPENELVIWVQEYFPEGYDDERAKGSFIKIKIKEILDADENRFKLEHENIFVPIEKHPDRKLPARSGMPSWSHEFLRTVRREKLEYETEKEAEANLLKVYLEYPNVVKCFPNRIFVKIYSRQHTEKDRGKSYILDVVEKPNGKFHIIYRENIKVDDSFKLYNSGFKLI